MITCIVLGTGIPTIPNYIITAAIAGPALLALGVPLIVSHMFVFYFGIFADLTPPVALACFAAAPIARESGLKISYDAMKIATAGFVVPFMAVYAPELMLQPGGPLTEAVGFPLAVAYILGKAILAIGLWGGAIVGYLAGPLSWPMRLARRRRRAPAGAGAAGDRRARLRPRRCRARPRLVAPPPRPPGVSLCILAGGAVTALAVTGFTLDWEHSVEHVAWAEAWRVEPAGLAPRRGPGPGLGRRDGARSRRPARGRMVDLAADGAAGPGARARRIGRHRRRLAAVPRRRLPPARRHPRPAGPAAALRRLIPVPGRGAWLNECVAADFVATGKLQETDGKPTPMSSG